MNNIYSIGVHWYNRPATLAESTIQFLDFLKLLQIHNPNLFRKYCKRAGSKKKALESTIDLEFNAIAKLLGDIKNQDKFPELSYRGGLWNGETDDFLAASISVTLGSSETKSWTNNCVIHLPQGGSNCEFYQTIENRKSLLLLLIDFWKPEFYMIDGKRYPVDKKERENGSLFRNLFR